MAMYKAGQIAYLIESRRFIREGKILQVCGNLVLFRFLEGGGTRVAVNKLYPTEEAAQAAQAALDGIHRCLPGKSLAFYL